MCGIVGYIGKKDAYPILIKVYIVWNTEVMTPLAWLF